MSNQLDPTIDQWYQHSDKGELLRVIAVDQAAGAIEIQNFDGDIEELDFDAWRDMDLELAEQPEDWTGPYDDIEADDLGYASDTGMAEQDWRTPLDTLHTRDESWQDARSAEPYTLEQDEGRQKLRKRREADK